MYKSTFENFVTGVSHLELETRRSESISVVFEDALEFHHLESQVSPFSTPKSLFNDMFITI